MQTTRLTVDLEKRLETFQLSVQLEVSTEILVLFGPSGAGKTTTLNAIAGLLTPDAGAIVLDGTPFFRKQRPGVALNVPARKRRMGYVFQHYALFPHLTALENAAYALWRQRHGLQRAMELLERMSIAHLAHRYPHEMSGGQQQRVAMARALAAAPAVLLLDEPFSALDVAVRERLQQDLRAVQAALGLVVVYVTHSLDDAFAVGHRLAVIQEGHIEQIGPIEEVFSRPMNHDIAVIMGIRNLIHARVVEATPERLLLDWDGLPLEAPPQALDVGAIVTAYIRPEDVKVLYPDRPLMSAVSHNQILGRIVDGRFSVGFRTLRVSIVPHGHEVEVRFPVYAYTPLSLRPGAEVRLSLRREGVVILHPSKERVSN
ncbi:MAG: ABC transporter ATP-binding protein [Nitrospinae bacterium]|nr:ABC transporter ATP-binding protein [Nitrospinota bacterium]